MYYNNDSVVIMFKYSTIASKILTPYGGIFR